MMSNKFLPPCPFCREPMKLVRKIDRLSNLPEIRVFYCAACKHPETEVIREAA
jgi:hypothetical protein